MSLLKNLVRLYLIETIDEEEELDEFSSAGGAGSIGSFGYSVPLGWKPKKKKSSKKSKL